MIVCDATKVILGEDLVQIIVILGNRYRVVSPNIQRTNTEKCTF